MIGDSLLPVDRFLVTLEVVAKEAAHLEWSRAKLFENQIDSPWVDALSTQPERAERLEAFVSRYGRLQGTLVDKLLPRWLLALAERPGSQIEVLNRAERLGVVESTIAMLEARQLRNRVVHEYMTDSAAFAEDLHLAEAYSRMLIETYRRVRDDAQTRMNLPADRLPHVG
jgi:hypothetical protein